jgi:diguanylate cyclase (GGDEF)-like protein
MVVSVRDITFQYRINEALQAYTEGKDLTAVLRVLCGALLGMPIRGRSAILDTATGEAMADVHLDLAAFGPAPATGPRRPWDEAVATGEATFPADLDGFDDELRAGAARAGIATVWAVPVAIAGSDETTRPRACIVVAKAEAGEPSINERYTIANLARSAALVMEREVLLGELARSARSDPLTGLANRAHLFRSRNDEHGDGGRDRPVAVLAVDLDGFKPINDEHGHAAGDAVLVEVARRMATTCRSGDELGRVGGDEFVMLCWGVVEQAEATAVADRLLAALAEPIRLPGVAGDGPTEAAEAAVEVGASIGIALSAGGGEPLEQAMVRADTALYDAKRRGRHRWSIAAP